jgi:hypothetical protein
VLAEAVALVQYAGYDINNNTIFYLLENQNVDGGWGIYVNESSSSHTTGLALWSLVQWRDRNV